LICRIDNPKYKGIWVAPDIDNPDFKDDPKLYLQKDLKYIGFELWQVSQQQCSWFLSCIVPH
jgi:calreticulin